MDDLAPAAAQRTSDDRGRAPGENFAARKKSVRKVQPVPVQNPDPEPEPEPEPEADHQLDVLA